MNISILSIFLLAYWSYSYQFLGSMCLKITSLGYEFYFFLFLLVSLFSSDFAYGIFCHAKFIFNIYAIKFMPSGFWFMVRKVCLMWCLKGFSHFFLLVPLWLHLLNFKTLEVLVHFDCNSVCDGPMWFFSAWLPSYSNTIDWLDHFLLLIWGTIKVFYSTVLIIFGSISWVYSIGLSICWCM